MSLVLLLLLGCGGEGVDSGRAPTCAERFAHLAPAESREELEPFLAIAREAFYPELDGASIALIDMAADSPYFSSNLDLTTVEAPPLERAYRIQVHPAYFQPPLAPPEATGAVLVHELKHLLDYSEKAPDELADFGLWYATADDVSEYERATDLGALERGCGEGLIAFREWMYPRLTPEQLEEKRHNYYTPEEIEAWMADNG